MLPIGRGPLMTNLKNTTADFFVIFQSYIYFSLKKKGHNLDFSYDFIISLK